jgi:hypothetical protein
MTQPDPETINEAAKAVQEIAKFGSKVLETAEQAGGFVGLSNLVLTAGLPETFVVSSSLGQATEGVEPELSDDVKFSLANLTRLGCVALETSWTGHQIFRDVVHAILGKKFVEASTLVVMPFHS